MCLTIAQRISQLRASLPEGVELAAVSKFHPVEAIRQAYSAGQRIFCESRVSELEEKVPALPGDIEWHFIGHVQTNKLRRLVKYADVIQSVDSLRLLSLVNAEAARIGRHIKVLLQAHVAMEDTKFGFLPEELLNLPAGLADGLTNVTVGGLMGMASNTDDITRIDRDFTTLANLFQTLRTGSPVASASFSILSMGMSDDYPLAIEHGSNMVRIGTSIFGERQY